MNVMVQEDYKGDVSKEEFERSLLEMIHTLHRVERQLTVTINNHINEHYLNLSSRK